MYEFSRSLYLELRDDVIGLPERRIMGRRLLLSASERTVEHLALKQDSATHTAQRLFRELRSLFSAADQLTVRLTIQRHVDAALAFFSTEEGTESVVAILHRCRAATSRGKPCQRAALRGLHYCPSHKRLSEDRVATAA
jgi:hypothetical protein